MAFAVTYCVSLWDSDCSLPTSQVTLLQKMSF